MKHNAPLSPNKKNLLQQMQCIAVYSLFAVTMLWLLSKLNILFSQPGLLIFGWISWTFIEYMVHRFWMHGHGNGELFNHIHHHSHPTEISVSNRQRFLLMLSSAGMMYIAMRFHNYFTVASGFYSGLVGYFFVHSFLHKKWFGKICPRLQQFHILHHCKLPNHCYGVTVHWWDFVFNTVPPKKTMVSDRVVQFYFSGKGKLIAVAMMAMLCTSCAHYYYAPNTNNAPLLKDKNEGKLNLGYYVTDEASGLEFQGALATGKHTGFMLNFLTASNKGSLSGSPAESSGGGNYLEAASGYFSRISNSDWVFETYGGLGTGTINNTYLDLQQTKVGITKVFIQPSIGWATKYFEAGISGRLAFVNLKLKDNTVKEANNPEDFYDIEYIQANPSGIVFEPGFVLRGGFKGMKFMLNFTSSINMNRSWKQEEGAFTFGLSIPFRIIPE